MSFDWRSLPAEEMEQHFNPRAALPDVEQRLEVYASRSAAAREALIGEYDLRFGDGAKETLDLYRSTAGHAGVPLVLFIHGGYWRALDKSDHSFVVPPLLETGAVVANMNYDLCPTVTLDTMVEQMAHALAFCQRNASAWGADPRRVVLVGHSAGAHLAAEMLLRDWPDGEAPDLAAAVLLTGVYEPEVILQVSVNEEARISPDVAIRRRCLGRPFTLRPRVLVAAGSDEPPGWQGQSQAFAGACRDAGLNTTLLSVPGGNHFTVLERAVSPTDPLGIAIRELIESPRA